MCLCSKYSRRRHNTSGPISEEPPRISAYTLYLWKLESSAYILPLIVWIYLRSTVSGELRKKTFFCKSDVVFGRSRLSKVIDFCTNRKRLCDFLLVRQYLVLSCKVSEILGLQVFVLITPPLFHPNFGGIRVGPDR